LYVADTLGHQIRRMNEEGELKVFAGSGLLGRVDGRAEAAQFSAPHSLTFDAQGNCFVADTNNHAIRRISTTGDVTTYAGDGTQGYQDGARAQARFNQPLDVAFGKDGALYVADSGNLRIRKITSGGQVSTFAGSGNSGLLDGLGVAANFRDPHSLVFDGMGELYVADSTNHALRRITAAGQVTTVIGVEGNSGHRDGEASQALLRRPTGVTVDASGRLYIADEGNLRLRRYDRSTGQVETLAGSGQGGKQDGAADQATFESIHHVAVAPNGAVYLAELAGQRIRKVEAGRVSTMGEAVVFRDGAAKDARFWEPQGIAYEASGAVLIADTKNHRIRRLVGGQVTTLAGDGTAAFKEGVGAIAQFHSPTALALAANGDLYVADTGNHRIRKITPQGLVSTFAGNGDAGKVDGTGDNASFSSPSGLAFAANGDLYVADTGNHSLRKITPQGEVSTVAGDVQGGYRDGAAAQALFLSPRGLSFTANGDLYIADTGNHRIRRLDTAGQVTRFAGSGEAGFRNGSAEQAQFNEPYALIVDGAGVVFVADRQNHRIRRIEANGAVGMIAGGSTGGYADGEVGKALFQHPSGVALDAQGFLLVADTENACIRRIGR
jgi:sugar lactone lactonase YvrE